MIEIFSAIVIVVPIIVPVAAKYNIDPIHVIVTGGGGPAGRRTSRSDLDWAENKLYWTGTEVFKKERGRLLRW